PAAPRSRARRVAAHPRGGRQRRVLRARRDHPRDWGIRALASAGPGAKPLGRHRPAAHAAAGGAVPARSAHGDREDAAQSSPGPRPRLEDGELPEQHPRAARGAGSGRRRRDPARPRRTRHRRDHVQRLLRPARSAGHAAPGPRHAGGSDPRPVHRDRPGGRVDPPRGAARSRGARRGRRSLHDQHVAGSDGCDQPRLPRIPRRPGAQGRRREARSHRPAAAHGVPPLRRADAPARMKTPRRRFLSVLGGALVARALHAERDLFSGMPAPDDPLELLYSRRLSFSGGEPLITVRVLEGRQQIVFVPKAPLTVRVRSRSGEMTTAVAGGASGRWTLQLLESSQGAGASWVELEQLRYDDKQGLQKAREDWAAKRVAIRIATVGEAYGIAGHVVDTRKYSVLADGDGTEAAARQKAQDLQARLGVRVQIRRELAIRPRARIELRDPRGNSAGIGESAVELRADAGLTVELVEYGMGYSFHGYEDRTYPERLFATVDGSGSLALV